MAFVLPKSGKIVRFPLLFALAVFLAGCQQQIDQSQPAKFSDLTIFFQNVISYLAPVAAVAFLIMVFIAGFQFLTSGGDQKAVAGARTTLTYAIIGIILVVASWLILLLVKQITGVETTKVEIPEPPPAQQGPVPQSGFDDGNSGGGVNQDSGGGSW